MAALARCTFYPVCHVVDDWCGLLRALFVAAADLVARLAFEPIEVPVGLVTAAGRWSGVPVASDEAAGCLKQR